jgi:superkiller protein 3
MNDWNDAERRVERAQELYEQRKLQEAVDELRAAIAINPYNSGWFFNLGLTLDELDRAEEAIDAYKQALDIDPNDLQTMNRLGMDLHRVGGSSRRWRRSRRSRTSIRPSSPVTAIGSLPSRS